jgi:hypothetical protein
MINDVNFPHCRLSRNFNYPEDPLLSPSGLLCGKKLTISQYRQKTQEFSFITVKKENY